MSDSDNTVATAYGRLDKTALQEVQNSYDTTTLLRIVDELDAIIVATEKQDGLREMLLRLHGMAHTVINGAGLSVATDKESLPELAADVIFEVRELIARLEEWVKQVAPLEKLAART